VNQFYYGTSACGVPSPPLSGAQTNADPSVATNEEQTEGKFDLELAVLDALKDYHYGRAAAFDTAANQVVVTIWTDGKHLTDVEVDELREAAEGATDGVPVVIVLSDDSPPGAT
jgi:hypothetical protein